MPTARPVPEGHHTITPHLVIRDAAKAIDFYKKAFGAREINRMAMPNGKIMHAELQIGDSMLYLADEFPEAGSRAPQSLGGTPVVLNVYIEDVDNLWEKAVAAGATVKMPLDDQFWGDRYGQLVDPFGHAWGLATHMEDVAPDEMESRAREAMEKFAAGKKATSA
ncbi:MAG: VOC family protein [Acidobacteriota bacterium]|nr:VOC family protein [Acidobacteriota bacterium]